MKYGIPLVSVKYTANCRSIKPIELGPRATQECAYKKRRSVVMGQKVHTP
jgi:hypothetical protein